MESIISITWPDNSTYKGGGIGSYPHGKGLYTTRAGLAYEGIWYYGFSFGLFKIWLEYYLEYTNPYQEYLKTKLNEIQLFQKTFSLIGTREPIYIVKSTFLLAKQLQVSSRILLSNFHEYLVHDAVEHSNQSRFSDRLYSCGGRFPSLQLVSEKIISLSGNISPCRELIGEIEKLEIDIEKFKSFFITTRNYDSEEKNMLQNLFNS